MMFGFLGKGKSKTGQRNGPMVASLAEPSTVMYSSQAAAALAAAAAAGKVSGNTGPARTGRRLHGKDITVDLDALKPGEKVLELQVQPITLLKFDHKLEHTQQVAVSSSYICYGLKAGHIRALNRNTAARALFRGHPTRLSHMAFFSAAGSLLASASRQGDLTVRAVADGNGPDGETAPSEALLLRAQLQLPPGADVSSSSSPPVSLAWHPTTPQILAAGGASGVNIFEVPTTPPAEQPPALVGPGIQYALPTAAGSSVAVTAAAFSPAGDLLVAADSAGSVHVWWLEGDGEEGEAPLLSWQPFGGSSDAAAGAAAVASVQVLHQADDGSTVLMTGDARNAALKLWSLPPAAALDGASPVCLQAVQFVSSARGADDVFCHAVVQRELQLVVLANTVRKQVYTLHYSLSGSAATSLTSAAGAAFDYAAFWGVQQPILSLATGLEAAESQEMAPPQLLLYTVQTDAIQQYWVNPALCSSSGEEEEEAAATEPEVVLAPADEASAAAAAAANGSRAVAADVADGEEVSSRTVPPPEAAAAPTAVEAEAAAEPESTPAAAAAAAAVADAPVAAAVPPPAQLPTPGLLLHAKASEPEMSAQVAATEPAAASTDADASSSAAADSFIGSSGKQEAAAVAKAHENALTTSVVPVSLPPMPTSSLLHSAEKAPAAPAAAVTADGAEVPAAANAPASAAPDAPPAAAVAPADVAALQQQMAQLLVMQQEMAAQLQANSQQTVAGVKGELSRALKATEGSLAKQAEVSAKAAAKRAEEERRKAAAKDRAELAALLDKALATQLGQVSAALQRDLLKGLADAAREQSRSTVTAVVNAVAPVVAHAVTGSLQQELASSAAAGGPLAAALERSLAASLAQPLHEALRDNFAASIIPAFERATQVMFGQVESAFTAWLADSSRTAGAAQSDAAASLSSSLQQLQAVVGSMQGDLADTSRSLSRIASSTASRAAEAGSGGGSGPRTAQQREAGAGSAAAAAPPADPRVEIGALLGVRKYEDALVMALNTQSLDVLVWACKQVDPQVVLGGSSVGLSQTTLLSLVHQLSSGLQNDANTPLKLAWLAEAAPVVDPHDPVTAPHLKVVLTGVMSSLKVLVSSLPQNDVMAKKGKIALHLFNSLLHQ